MPAALVTIAQNITILMCTSLHPCEDLCSLAQGFSIEEVRGNTGEYFLLFFLSAVYCEGENLL